MNVEILYFADCPSFEELSAASFVLALAGA